MNKTSVQLLATPQQVRGRRVNDNDMPVNRKGRGWETRILWEGLRAKMIY